MSTYQNILIDTPFVEGEEFERLFSLKDNPLLTNARKVTLVNVYNSKLEGTMPHDLDVKDLDQVEYVIKEKLEKLRNIIDPEEKIKWEVKVIFNSETKNACVYYAREIKADLVIISTRGVNLSHIQNESFAQYMLESCPADILVMKHQ